MSIYPQQCTFQSVRLAVPRARDAEDRCLPAVSGCSPPVPVQCPTLVAHSRFPVFNGPFREEAFGNMVRENRLQVTGSLWSGSWSLQSAVPLWDAI